MEKEEAAVLLSSMLHAHPDASDLLFAVGHPPQVQVFGELFPANLSPPPQLLSPDQTDSLAMALLGSHQNLREQLRLFGSVDFSCELEEVGRLRVNVFMQRGRICIVVRRFPGAIPSLDELGLSEKLRQVTEERDGLILVVGAAGSGKSTTLAALIHEMSPKRAVHMITLEDPVEFIHSPSMATISQRELGTDFDSFASGLRAALRQAPKVIMVGEMRDRESLQTALTAAETGHLVLSSLHTLDCGQTIHRILSMVDPSELPQTRSRLADTIRWVIGQRLIPRIRGGRILALEILRSTLRTKEVILNGESEGKTFYEIEEQGEAYGMTTFDQSILALSGAGIISEEMALSYATKRSVMTRGLDQIKMAAGEKTSPLQGLKIERPKPRR
jgi:twitching motility protein PilT